MLKLKPQIQNFSINNLGFITPNKTIKFMTPEAANEYAKNMVVKALNQKNAFERLVLIKGSEVVAQIDGDMDTVILSGKPIIHDTSVHGHPDTYAEGVTTPISTGDARSFFENIKYGLRKMIVYNSKGEENTFKFNIQVDKVPEPVRNLIVNKKLNLVEKIENQLIFLCIMKLEQLKKQGLLEKFIEDIKVDDIGDALAEKMGIILHHLTWLSKAEELGVEYKTNFSNLTPEKVDNFFPKLK